MPIWALASCSPEKRGGNCVSSIVSPAFLVTWPSGTKSSRPVWPTSRRIASGSDTPGSSMTIRSLPWVVTSGSETPVAFTRFSMIWRIDLEVLGPRDLVADLLRLVLDAESALQVQPELRLDRAAAGVARIGKGETRNDVDDEGEDADDDDQDRTGFAHQRRMIQDGPGNPGSGFLTVPVRRRSVPSVSRRDPFARSAPLPGGALNVRVRPDGGRRTEETVPFVRQTCQTMQSGRADPRQCRHGVAR